MTYWACNHLSDITYKCHGAKLWDQNGSKSLGPKMDQSLTFEDQDSTYLCNSLSNSLFFFGQLKILHHYSWILSYIDIDLDILFYLISK